MVCECNIVDNGSSNSEDLWRRRVAKRSSKDMRCVVCMCVSVYECQQMDVDGYARFDCVG